MSRIFLSYARDDVDTAKQLADGLAQAGHDVWWDRHLHGGSRFDREIEEALGNAEAVVVLWSNASLDSAWVKDEAAEARDSERLVPVSIGSAKPPLGFRQFHTIDLGCGNGHGLPDALAQLLSAIDRTCGSVESGKRATAKAAESRTTNSVPNSLRIRIPPKSTQFVENIYGVARLQCTQHRRFSKLPISGVLYRNHGTIVM